jgi:O-antigen ligase
MNEKFAKLAAFAGAILMVPVLAYIAYTRPGYFSNQTYLGGLVVLEFLIVALWMYRRVFFTLILLAFLFAGVDLPVGGFWTSGRWVFLFSGAFMGCFVMLKERNGKFSLFHVLALFAVLSALVSAAVSRYPGFALLKVASLLFLFLYAGTGARLAVVGREKRFFAGLLLGCEVFVGAVGALYLLGREVMGNPNSLGAVMCVVAPILLWGMLIDQEPMVHHRRLLLFVACMYMLFRSQSRAGLLAGLISCGLLCLALRKYKLFGQGMVIILIMVASAAIFDPEAFSKTVTLLTSSVIYKDKDPGLGVFGSRKAPWQAAIDSIHKHVWFGSGFGTSDSGQGASAHLGNYSSNTASNSENGSSYLTIVAWVGLAGVAPFVFLLLSLLNKILRTLLWMLQTRSPFHPAVPLAMVVVAGLIHAVFEDWLFAPGYYLCVFFWSLAFVFVDLAPWAPLPSLTVSRRTWSMRPSMSGVASSR